MDDGKRASSTIGVVFESVSSLGGVWGREAAREKGVKQQIGAPCARAPHFPRSDPEWACHLASGAMLRGWRWGRWCASSQSLAGKALSCNVPRHHIWWYGSRSARLRSLGCQKHLAAEEEFVSVREDCRRLLISPRGRLRADVAVLHAPCDKDDGGNDDWWASMLSLLRLHFTEPQIALHLDRR